LNLRNVVKISILRKNSQPLADSSCCDPNIHDLWATATSPGLCHDRGEDSGDLGVDGDCLETTLNPAHGSKPQGTRWAVLSQQHAQVQLGQRDDRDCRLVGQAGDRTASLHSDKDGRIE